MSTRPTIFLSHYNGEHTSLPPNYPNLTPKKQVELKRKVSRWLENTRDGRHMVHIGVTAVVPFKDGTHQGSLQPGKVYQCTWEEFAALKLDSVRSSYVILMDARKKTAVEIACMGMLGRIRTFK